MKNKFRIGYKEKEVLKIIALSTLAVSSLILPSLPMATMTAIRGYKKIKNLSKKLVNLQSKDLIYLGGEKIKLTKKGKDLAKKYLIEDIEIKKDKWDGKWRIIAYDIPNKYNKERDYFRKKLCDLGFENIQKSLWVIPYECKEEISIITQNLRISPYVIYLSADKLPNEQEMQNIFRIN